MASTRVLALEGDGALVAALRKVLAAHFTGEVRYLALQTWQQAGTWFGSNHFSGKDYASLPFVPEHCA